MMHHFTLMLPMGKRFHHSSASLILIFLVVIVLPACDTEQRAWDKAQLSNSSDSWGAYIESYPKSNRASVARAKKAVLDLGEGATALNYRELLFRTSPSPFANTPFEVIHPPTLVAEALARISSLNLKELQKTPTLPDIFAYATEFNSQNADSLWKLATQAVSSNGKIRYPNGELVTFVINEKYSSDGVSIKRSFKDDLQPYVLEIAHEMGINPSFDDTKPAVTPNSLKVTLMIDLNSSHAQYRSIPSRIEPDPVTLYYISDCHLTLTINRGNTLLDTFSQVCTYEPPLHPAPSQVWFMEEPFRHLEDWFVNQNINPLILRSLANIFGSDRLALMVLDHQLFPRTTHTARFVEQSRNVLDSAKRLHYVLDHSSGASIDQAVLLARLSMAAYSPLICADLDYCPHSGHRDPESAAKEWKQRFPKAKFSLQQNAVLNLLRQHTRPEISRAAMLLLDTDQR